MVGKLQKSWPGEHVNLLVAADRFTKLIEAKPVTSADATSTVNFIKGIVFWFGIPNSIVTENDSNLVQGLLRRTGHQITVCVHSTSTNQQPSREIKRPHLQWDQEIPSGATRESKACLG
jgi:hypothetical protein